MQPCYAFEQATKYLLSKRYGVQCKRSEYLSEAKEAANMAFLEDKALCGVYNEVIKCFFKGKTSGDCQPITIKTCDGFDVGFVEPNPKPCNLNVSFL